MIFMLVHAYFFFFKLQYVSSLKVNPSGRTVITGLFSFPRKLLFLTLLFVDIGILEIAKKKIFMLEKLLIYYKIDASPSQFFVILYHNMDKRRLLILFVFASNIITLNCRFW
jgi:hypothetical protein